MRYSYPLRKCTEVLTIFCASALLGAETPAELSVLFDARAAFLKSHELKAEWTYDIAVDKDYLTIFQMHSALRAAQGRPDQIAVEKAFESEIKDSAAKGTASVMIGPSGFYYSDGVIEEAFDGSLSMARSVLPGPPPDEVKIASNMQHHIPMWNRFLDSVFRTLEFGATRLATEDGNRISFVQIFLAAAKSGQFKVNPIPGEKFEVNVVASAYPQENMEIRLRLICSLSLGGVPEQITYSVDSPLIPENLREGGEIKYTDYTEVKPGYFLPKKLSATNYTSWNSRFDDSEIALIGSKMKLPAPRRYATHHYEFNLKSLALSASENPPKKYSLKIEPGTMIRDQTTGLNYEFGEALKSQLEKLKTNETK